MQEKYHDIGHRAILARSRHPTKRPTKLAIRHGHGSIEEIWREKVMIRKTLVWLFVVAVIGVMLGGASLIITNNSAMPGADVPSGFLH
jgi:hypothetical protein